MKRSIVGVTTAMVHYSRRPPHSISPASGRGGNFADAFGGQDGPPSISNRDDSDRFHPRLRCAPGRRPPQPARSRTTKFVAGTALSEINMILIFSSCFPEKNYGANEAVNLM